MVRDLKLDERQSIELYAPVGCLRCLHTGFLGRMAIFEVMRFTPTLRDVILTKPTIGDIRKAAGDWLFRTLADSGRRKVLEGLTSFEEAERVASGD
jgi:type II secretory ATPase GspE/PulE/Tfp pilus assembly ATPase PilB-like protein